MVILERWPDIPLEDGLRYERVLLKTLHLSGVSGVDVVEQSFCPLFVDTVPHVQRGGLSISENGLQFASDGTDQDSKQ